jgi:RNA polymerase primary sigma factor
MPRGDGSDRSQAAYARDVRAHDVMTAEEERALALELEAYELDEWRIILERPAFVRDVLLPELDLATLFARLDSAEAITHLADKLRRMKKAGRKWWTACEAFARKVRLVDDGREVVTRAARIATEYGRKDQGERILLARKRARRARDSFVAKNLRLVLSVAARGPDPTGDRKQDRVQNGNIGLIKAVERFDIHMGNRFSTFAHWWIRQAILRSECDTADTIRVPVHLHDGMRAVGRQTGRFLTENGRLPTIAELGRLTGLSVKKVTVIHEAIRVRGTMSLDKPAGRDPNQDDRHTLLDTIPDPFSDPAAVFEGEETARLVKQAMADLRKVLKPREQAILDKRFLSGEGITLQEVGREMGLTRERIRQIQMKLAVRVRQVLLPVLAGQKSLPTRVRGEVA